MVYILHSHIVGYVPSNVVKNILNQPEPEGNRAKWIVVLLGYDLDINPTKLLKGKGFFKLMTYSICESLQLNFLSNHSNKLDLELQVLPEFDLSSWYNDIIYVLQNLQATLGLIKISARSVKIKATIFFVMNQYLNWKYPGGILLNFLLENESLQTMK